jgi:hypothetical protein
MGMDFGLASNNFCIKMKFRWLLKIQDVSADGINALPPAKSSRPQLSFKEMDIQHLNETVYFPSKPEWKPLPLTLYDLKKNKHPVWEWIKLAYNPALGKWSPAVTSKFKKSNARLEIYDGCGNTLETWIFDNVYPQDANFGDLDMGASEYITCDLQLRFDRAYQAEDGNF